MLLGVLFFFYSLGNISQPPGHFSRDLNLAQAQRQTDTMSGLMLEHNPTDASIVVAGVEPFQSHVTFYIKTTKSHSNPVSKINSISTVAQSC